ncbi:SpoIIIAH-like family protein [Clostridium sp. Cult1]|uniref:SpoIIIAH-like family protein n=1 Tax=Clostridium sp. Cult1 TaxID=2079002 RepID=UPI001F35E399|nr:SpoIIIAH-like family protein [Clostridium sp. Cult1]MCF6464249.1 stage III sporulation protein AH [Clostridium sp. Cult1]
MLSIKKPAIIFVLIVLLIFTGYINHNLTKQALSKVSNDYQKHEEMELAKGNYLDDKDLVPAISEGDEKDEMEILDTKNFEDIEEMTKNTEENIQEAINREDSLRSKNYYIEQRLSRDKLRAGLIDRLNEIVNNDNTNEEMRTEAQKKIMKIGELSEKELVVEGLIKAKGFDDVLIFLTDESAKVVVSTEELNEQDVVKILDVVMTETDLEASNIKIMKKN